MNAFIPSDIIMLALLYKNYKNGYHGNIMIGYDNMLEYAKVINDNLFLIGKCEYLEYSSRLFQEYHKYIILVDDNEKEYFALNPEVDMQETYKYIIGGVQFDILVASQEDNALEVIGLQKTEKNEIVSKKVKTKLK